MFWQIDKTVENRYEILTRSEVHRKMLYLLPVLQ